MMASSLNIHCSRRCELLLCLSYLLTPEAVTSIASKLATNRDQAARNLAQAMMSLSPQYVRDLSLKTLANAGMSIGNYKNQTHAHGVASRKL